MSTLDYKAWPYREANAILEKLEREQKASLKRKSERVILQTGYGPSGFPHVGTFSEVARTDYVRQALAALNSDQNIARMQIAVRATNERLRNPVQIATS